MFIERLRLSQRKQVNDDGVKTNITSSTNKEHYSLYSGENKVDNGKTNEVVTAVLNLPQIDLYKG